VARRTSASRPAGDSASSSTTTVDRLRAVGAGLGQALREILGALPGAPLRPNQLAACLGVNRAVASKVLNATARRDPLETLHLVPGPEPLRRLARAARRQGVGADPVARAEAAIEASDPSIRRDAGNRAAPDALISASLPGARERFELASK